jgi:hypothetical protein
MRAIKNIENSPNNLSNFVYMAMYTQYDKIDINQSVAVYDGLCGPSCSRTSTNIAYTIFFFENKKKHRVCEKRYAKLLESHFGPGRSRKILKFSFDFKTKKK